MNAQLAQQLLNDAIEAMQAGKDAVALSLARNAASQSAEKILNLQFVLGILLCRSGQLQAGVRALEQELRDFPGNQGAKELLASLSQPAPSSGLKAFDTTLDARLTPAVEALQSGNTQAALDLLNKLRSEDRNIPFLHHLCGAAYAALGQLSYAHEMYWEEIAHFPTNKHSRPALKQIPRNAVIDHFVHTTQERNPRPHMSQQLDIVTGHTISGGYYVRFRSKHEFLSTPNLEFAHGVANYLRGDHSHALDHLAKEGSSSFSMQAAQALSAEIRQAPASETQAQRWQKAETIISSALNQAVASAGRKKYVVLYPGIDIWTDDKVNDIGREQFGPIFQHLSRDPNVEVTFVTIDGRHGLQGTDYSLGPLRVNRKPDAVVTMHPWWGEEHIVTLVAREHGIPVIASEHGAHFSDFSIVQPKGDIRSCNYPVHASCLWSQVDYDIITKCYGSNDLLFITGNPMHDDLSTLKPALLPGVTAGYTLILSAGQGVNRQAFWDAADEISKYSQVVVKAHPLEPDIDGWRSKYPTFTRAEDLYPAVYHSTRVLAYISNALVPALYWLKPMWVMKGPKEDPIYDDFKSRHRGVFNFSDEGKFTKSMLENEIIPTPKDYETFAFLRDGQNAKRVADVARLMAI